MRAAVSQSPLPASSNRSAMKIRSAASRFTGSRSTAHRFSADCSSANRFSVSRFSARHLRVSLLMPLYTAAALLLAPAGVHAQTEAQPPLPTVQLQAGMYLIRAEVADTFRTRQVGLMFRDALGPNQGMLFAFEQPGVQCFWMKNTKIPLTAAFIDDQGRIVNLADMQPFDESSHCSAGPVRFVLEMTQGWYDKHGMKAGSAFLNPQIFRPATP